MTDPWQINIGKLRLLHVVGHGEFGLVRKAVLVNDGKLVDVAVKMIKGNYFISRWTIKESILLVENIPT